MRDEWRARECAKPMRQIFLRQAIASSIVLAISLASPLPGEAADPVFPPGSRIGLVPPAGMAPSTAFTGFEDSERHAVIVLSELAGSSYPDVEKEFSSEGMRAGGMEVERREDIALKDGPGFLIIARQRLSGTLVHRWALVLSSAAVTAIVTTTIPQPAKDAYPDSALRVALSSVTIRAEVPVEEQLAALPYSLGNLAEFRLLRAGRDGVAILTLGPKDTSIATEQPFFLIAPEPGPVPDPNERDGFARRVLAELPGLKELRFVRSEPIRINGRPSQEIIARAKDGKNNMPLVLVQWLRFGTGGYTRMLGIAGSDVWESVFPRMRALRDGIAPK
jgi:hypothetical protein